MMDTTTNDRPVMQWIEVADGRGTRLEARWTVPADVALVAQAAAA